MTASPEKEQQRVSAIRQLRGLLLYWTARYGYPLSCRRLSLRTVHFLVREVQPTASQDDIRKMIEAAKRGEATLLGVPIQVTDL